MERITGQKQELKLKVTVSRDNEMRAFVWLFYRIFERLINIRDMIALSLLGTRDDMLYWVWQKSTGIKFRKAIFSMIQNRRALGSGILMALTVLVGLAGVALATFIPLLLIALVTLPLWIIPVGFVAILTSPVWIGGILVLSGIFLFLSLFVIFMALTQPTIRVLFLRGYCAVRDSENGRNIVFRHTLSAKDD